MTITDSLLSEGRVRLSGRGRKRFLSGHPWIYADDLAQVDAGRGALVAVEGPGGEVAGWALYSEGTKLALRRITQGAEKPGQDFWRERVRAAVELRGRLGLLGEDSACRLLGGDAEGIPGLIVDVYAGVLVAQCGTQAADLLRDHVLTELSEALPFPVRAVLDRSDASVRRLEGLQPNVEWLAGSAPEELLVREGELVYEVDVEQGHKTGHYLDQRENRREFARRAAGARVYDGFCYDGLFGLRAALAGAREVVCVDQSGPAGERVRRNAERNGVAERVSFVRADVLKDLRARAGEAETFELVSIDPPPFARRRAELPGAERGYREVNRRALRVVAAGGHLFSSSCSHALRSGRLLELVADAAGLVGRETWLEELRGAGPDHPVSLSLPESSYLKCAVVRVA